MATDTRMDDLRTRDASGRVARSGEGGVAPGLGWAALLRGDRVGGDGHASGPVVTAAGLAAILATMARVEARMLALRAAMAERGTR
jgi:hypothetical protein